MADIVIRGMEMPQRCRDCCFAGFVFTCHLVGKTHDDVLRTRPDWCPLVPLPEGHGRLGDLDALANSDAVKMKGCAYQEEIFAAPTIVPADGGADNG